MWDLETIKTMNAEGRAPGSSTLPQHLRIYDIGGGKFALGQRGKKATWVVRRIANKKDSLGRGLPTYRGVQARKPVIGDDARIIPRKAAGRLLLAALGLR